MQHLWALRPIRVSAKLSQHTLARSAGLTQSRVSDLERGCRASDLAEVEAISRGLGLDAQILLANAITLTRSGRVRVAR